MTGALCGTELCAGKRAWLPHSSLQPSLPRFPSCVLISLVQRSLPLVFSQPCTPKRSCARSRNVFILNVLQLYPTVRSMQDIVLTCCVSGFCMSPFIMVPLSAIVLLFASLSPSLSHPPCLTHRSSSLVFYHSSTSKCPYCAVAQHAHSQCLTQMSCLPRHAGHWTNLLCFRVLCV